MRILITGAGGMLGLDVQAAAVSAGHQPVALTRSDLDVTNLDSVAEAIAAARGDVVINCAAYTDVDGAEDDPETANEVNAVGPGHVATAAARAGVWTLHVSSDYVFDGAKASPYVESDATRPLSVYGASKLAGEQAVARAAPHTHTIVRSSWLFGTGGRCFPDTMLRLAAERDEIDVVVDQVGCPTFTGHLAAALVDLATRPEPPLGVVHLAADGECSWHAFAVEIFAEAGVDMAVRVGVTADLARPAPRPAYSVLRTKRHAEAPQLPHWRDGLAAYLQSRVPAS